MLCTKTTTDALLVSADKALETLNARIGSIIGYIETKARSCKTRKKDEGNLSEDKPYRKDF
ncbi:MAG: hypothetical protein NW226_18375 [Microscillaceae bacterium]|nr:hypothetical protein [Microscillaceae bacterium]